MDLDTYNEIISLSPKEYQPIKAFNKRVDNTHNQIDLKYIDNIKIYREADKKIAGGNEGVSFPGDIIVIC